MILRLCVVLVALMFTACSSWFSGKPVREPAQLTEFSPTAHFDVRWHESVGEAGNSVLQPVVTLNAVYVANAKGEVLRLQRTDGKQVWRADSGFHISGGVGAGAGLVLVGGDKGDLAAFAEDGKLRWKAKVSSEVLSAPLIAEGIVIVRTGDGRIVGLNAEDGTRLWLYERSTPALVVRNHAGVALRRGIVFAGFAAGKMVALNAGSGTLVWEATVSQPRGNTELERISDITSLPVLDDEQICAVAFQGKLACFDLTQGNLLWSRVLSSEQGMALSGRYLYVTDADGTLLALDKSSGSVLWKNNKLSARQVSAPLVVGGYVVAGDFEGYVHGLARDDGRFGARIATEGSLIAAAPVALDDGLLVQTRSGGLYALALH